MSALVVAWAPRATMDHDPQPWAVIAITDEPRRGRTLSRWTLRGDAIDDRSHRRQHPARYDAAPWTPAQPAASRPTSSPPTPAEPTAPTPSA